jgi:LytS/YehU family sensor histidine kinase
MYFAMLVGFQAFAYFAEVREREIQVSRLVAQLAEARLDALRQQLNPHFLFNSLNAITVLVRERNTRAATRVLELLSDLLRQVLRPEQPREVPLSQELQFVEQYLAIERVRFPDRLRVELMIESEVRNALVPIFLLQPLVENAIRHGVTRRVDAGRIAISARREGEMVHLSIRDDGVGIDEHRSDGVGLSNTRERLRTLYGEQAILAITALPERGTEVSIAMPYRPQPV